MTVILVILIFAIFLLIDYFRTANQPVPQPEVVRPKQPLYQPIPAVVSGFQVPENLRYHPGHTWALSESPTLVRVGMDDFASKLVGKMEKISLPQRGQPQRKRRSPRADPRPRAIPRPTRPGPGNRSRSRDHPWPAGWR